MGLSHYLFSSRLSSVTPPLSSLAASYFSTFVDLSLSLFCFVPIPSLSSWITLQQSSGGNPMSLTYVITKSKFPFFAPPLSALVFSFFLYLDPSTPFILFLFLYPSCSFWSALKKLTGGNPMVLTDLFLFRDIVNYSLFLIHGPFIIFYFWCPLSVSVFFCFHSHFLVCLFIFWFSPFSLS